MGLKNLKIGLFGPWLFQLAVGLREIGLSGTRFIVDENEGLLLTALRDAPEIQVSSFAMIDDWMKPWDFVFPERSRLSKLFQEFDILILSYLAPIFAPSSRKPCIFFPMGDDLTGVPFPIKGRHPRPRGKQDIAAPLVAYRQRKGIRQSEVIWVPLWKPYKLAMRELKLSNPISYMPLAHDDKLFSPYDSDKQKPFGSEVLRIFSPSRLMMSKSKNAVRVGGTKNNERLLQAFLQVLESGLEAELVLIDQKHSPDRAQARKLVEDLGISDHVVWEKLTDGIGFSWHGLSDLYRSVDVVADDFGGNGWFGGVALEGLMSGLPVVTNIDDNIMKSHYPDHPFVKALTVEEIFASICFLGEPNVRKKIGEDSRKWAVEHHGRKQVAQKCLERLSELNIF